MNSDEVVELIQKSVAGLQVEIQELRDQDAKTLEILRDELSSGLDGFHRRVMRCESEREVTKTAMRSLEGSVNESGGQIAQLESRVDRLQAELQSARESAVSRMGVLSGRMDKAEERWYSDGNRFWWIFFVLFVLGGNAAFWWCYVLWRAGAMR